MAVLGCLLAYAQPAGAVNFKCHGFEPGWSLDIRPDRLTFDVTGDGTQVLDLIPTKPFVATNRPPDWALVYRTRTQDKKKSVIITIVRCVIAKCGEGESDTHQVVLLLGDFATEGSCNIVK